MSFGEPKMPTPEKLAKYPANHEKVRKVENLDLYEREKTERVGMYAEMLKKTIDNYLALNEFADKKGIQYESPKILDADLRQFGDQIMEIYKVFEKAALDRGYSTPGEVYDEFRKERGV